MNRLDRTHWTLLAALKGGRTLTAAAHALHITQAAASQRLSEAERRLGIPLVNRNGKRLKLNDAGERLAQSGIKLEQILHHAEVDAIWLSQQHAALVRMLQGYYDSANLTQYLFKSYQSETLDLQLEVKRSTHEMIEPILAEQRADFTLATQPAYTAGVKHEKLLEDQLVAVMRRDDPLTQQSTVRPEDFTTRTLLTYSLSPQQGWEYEQFFKPKNCYPKDIIKIESTDTILSMVAGGLGVSILPRLVTINHPSQQALHCTTIHSILLHWYLLASKSWSKSMHYKIFCQQTRDQLKHYIADTP